MTTPMHRKKTVRWVLLAALAAGFTLLLLQWRAPLTQVSADAANVASNDQQATSAQSPSSGHTLAEAPASLRERLHQSLLRGAQQASAEQLTQALNTLRWTDSEWQADPAAGLQRIQQRCQQQLSRAFERNADDSDIQQLCEQQLLLSLAESQGLTLEQASRFIAISQENPQPLKQFQQRSPLSDFDNPLQFFEQYWASQDALFGTNISHKVFGAQRDGMRFNQRFQDFLAQAKNLPLKDRLTWYEQQQQQFASQHGQPLSVLSSDAIDHVNRLISLYEAGDSANADDKLQQRYQLRRQYLSETSAERWRKREERQLNESGALAELN